MASELLTKYVLFRKADDGILEATWLPEVHQITDSIAREMIQARKDFQGPGEVCLLVRASKVTTATNDAMAIFASPEGTEGLIATAMVIPKHYWVLSTVVDWLVRVHHPQIPARKEWSETKARKWLLKEQKRHADEKRKAH
jgi:hypothetical protein